WASDLYRPTGDPLSTPLGPISNVLVPLAARDMAVAVVIAGALTAMGLAFLVAPPAQEDGWLLSRVMIGVHLALMTFVMPCLYESYYTTLLMPLLWLAGLNRCRASDARLAVAWCLLICLSGVLGSVIQLRK